MGTEQNPSSILWREWASSGHKRLIVSRPIRWSQWAALRSYARRGLFFRGRKKKL
jgi:hypothetical protein